MHELARRGLAIGSLLFAGGCGGARSSGPVTGRGGVDAPVRFLALQGTTMRFYDATPAGLKETRSLEVPESIEDIQWIGPEPVLLLNDYADNATRHGEIGRITATGYQPFPKLPEATWKQHKPSEEGLDHFDTPRWKLSVTADGEIWQGRCEWGYAQDESPCTEWVFARLSPAPVITAKEPPPSVDRSYAYPTITPPASVQASIVDTKRTPPPIGDVDDAQPLKLLRCTEAGKTIEYPPADDREHGMGDQLQWLSSSPPMFVVERWESGLDDLTSRAIIFEGCAESTRFPEANTETGPSGVFALIGEKTSVRWADREIGTLDDVTMIRFARVPKKK